MTKRMAGGEDGGGESRRILISSLSGVVSVDFVSFDLFPFCNAVLYLYYCNNILTAMAMHASAT